MSKRQAFIDFVTEWCEDDSHGYSQVHRWGPDCDCSSLMYMAANAAGYDVPTGSGYTGTMVGDFTDAGWSAVPFDGNVWDCEGGEIMLNVENHTEGVIAVGRFGGAHIDENGDVVGRTTGDQTGNEVSLCGAYIPSFGWDYVLIPPSDDDGGDEPAPSGDDAGSGREYRVYTKESGWLDWMRGTTCTCPDDCRDDFAGIEGQWIYGMEANFPFKVVLMDGSETDWCTQWHEDQAMRGLKIEDGRYQVHTVGNGWLKEETGLDDDGAGDDQYAVDMVRVW